MLDSTEIGKAIRERRKAMKLSMRELADNTGTTAATICRLESGKINNFNTNKVAPVLKYLRISNAILEEDKNWDNIEPEYIEVAAIAQQYKILPSDLLIIINIIGRKERED